MTGDRYTIISADGHAGGDFDAYRRYLDPRWLDEFDAWEKTYVNPFADLLQPTVYRNFDNERRLAETESDGIVAEILFPNTVPPFFDESGLVALPPTEADYDRRWAGLQAHNRWMADFCAAAPGRGAGWLPRGLETLDWFYRRMTLPEAAEAKFFGAVAKRLSMTPTEYFHRNFWVGASFLRPSESPLRYDVGVDHLMWGADYPHSEGSYPYTTEALRVAFADVDPAEVRKMVETNAAAFYDFDLDQLQALGDKIGPSVDDVAKPLMPDDYPSDSTCNAFDKAQVLRSW